MLARSSSVAPVLPLAGDGHRRTEAEAFLTRKWRRELDYRLIKKLWAFAGNRIAIRFACGCRDDSGP
ncbi:DUF1348 family protein [Belnapia mucosa]|uniref:DUF1348 family protein n=1 Tax=Belnapia mucosa TaxID=2804532 RepID=UPI001F22AD74|nr:DUF1348 family protein [Belnapia mucosa]